MRVRHLSLVHVRNYHRLALDLPAGPVVLTGDNGQGKSNLLEAVYVLATSKSYRTNQDRDLLNWSIVEPGADAATAFARFAAVVERLPLNVRLDVVIAPLPPESADRGRAGLGSGTPVLTSKRITINGMPRRAGDLVGQVHVVLFTPADLDLITGAPEGRRRYINVTLSQTDRAYYRALVQYNRVLAQRNSLLRQLREGRGRADQLGVWNDELARHGAAVTARRSDAVRRLGALVEHLYADLTSDPGPLGLHYVPSIAGEDGAQGGALNEHEALERFQRLLARQEGREVRAGMSLYGPHRDDIGFTLRGRDLSSYGSRGQQRAATVALKLAEVMYMRHVGGDAPVMLLDDVLSELDRPRREYLCRALPQEQQVLLTTADLDVVPASFLGRSTLYRVREGTLSQDQPVAAGDDL